MSGTRPTQTQHIEAIVLAFSHSRARTLVGTDALRTVVSGSYRDMFVDDAFHLESLWTLLETQPGFDPANIKPPLCRFKTWEADLEVPIVLPPQMGELSTLEIRALADECVVPHKELDRILERGAFTKEERAARQAKWTVEPEVEVATPTKAPSRFAPVLLVGLIIVALGGFGVAGFFIYDQFIRAAPTAEVAPAVFTGIPVKKAVRAGFDVKVLELTDESWFSKPAAEKEAAMRNTMTELSRDGIRGLFIRDKSGKVRAMAQTYGPELTRVRVTFK